MIPAVAAGIASVIGAGIGAFSQYKTNEAANEARKHEAELAFQRQKEQIKMQNAYNSPSAQMSRLAAAGLNPNLMYQQGEMGQQTGIAEYTPAPVTAPDMSPAFKAGTDFVNSMIGIKDVENKTMLAQSQVLLNSSTMDVNLSEIRLKDAQSKQILDLLGWQVSEYESKVRNLDSQTSLNESQKTLAEESIKKVSQEIDNLKKTWDLTDAQIKNLDAQTLEVLCLLPDKQTFMRASTAEKQALTAEAVERGMYISKYYKLQYRATKHNIQQDIRNYNLEVRWRRMQGEMFKTSQYMSFTNNLINASVGVCQASGGLSLGQVYGGNAWNTDFNSTFSY